MANAFLIIVILICNDPIDRLNPNRTVIMLGLSWIDTITKSKPKALRLRLSKADTVTSE